MATSNGTRSRRILIVDDSMVSRTILRKMLERDEGIFEVFEANNATSAKNAVEEYNPEIILMDISMPGMDGFELTRKLLKVFPHLKIIMISGYKQKYYGQKAKLSGATVFLEKPVERPRLLQAIEQVMKGDTAGEEAQENGEEYGDEPVRVLVVEDRPMSQKIALALLKRQGFEAHSADSGQEALEALSGKTFDILLMDIEMPEMDGYETTRAVRDMGYVMPIVAMTAHEESEVKEKAIAAGMNDFITKPLKAEEVKRIVEEYVQRERPPIDVQALCREVGYDAQVLREIVGDFLSTVPQELEHLKAALSRNDGDRVDRISHILVGELANLRAKKASQKAQDLMLKAQEKRFPEAEEVLQKLKEDIYELEIFLSQQDWDEILKQAKEET